jgi:hypothetical protein
MVGGELQAESLEPFYMVRGRVCFAKPELIRFEGAWIVARKVLGRGRIEKVGLFLDVRPLEGDELTRHLEQLANSCSRPGKAVGDDTLQAEKQIAFSPVLLADMQ